MAPPPTEPWYRTFFTGLALDLWRAAIPEEVTRVQADGLRRLLALEAGHRVLDVPCGNGRVALELASGGAIVRGVDIAADFVREGEASARERGLDVELVCGDMRELPGPAGFDAAYCVGNSFGYLEEEGNRAFLSAVARSLRPGARFVLEYPMTAELALPRGEKTDRRRIGDIEMTSEATYDALTSRLETMYTFRRGDEVHTGTASYQIYTCRELVEMLEHAGFDEIEVFADLDGTAFGLGAEDLWVRCARR